MSAHNALSIEGIDDESVASILNGSRTYTQYLDTVDKVRRGICPFCPEHFDNDLNRVFTQVGFEESAWQAWENPYPHNHTKRYIIAAPIRHITHPNQMSPFEWEVFAELMSTLVNQKKGGGMVMRFGDPALNAGSLRHLHANIIVPDGTGGVRVTLAKSPEHHAETLRRVQIFEELRRADCDSFAAARALGQHILSQDNWEFIRNRLD